MRGPGRQKRYDHYSVSPPATRRTKLIATPKRKVIAKPINVVAKKNKDFKFYKVKNGTIEKSPLKGQKMGFKSFALQPDDSILPE